MGQFKEIKGNLIELSQSGEFDVIVHGCNCFNTQGAGLAPQMVKAYQTDKFPMELTGRGDYNKLGQIDYQKKWRDKGNTLIVVNVYSQYNYGRNHADGDLIPLDYDALRLCMRKINKQFKGKHIGVPLIGCGLAGGLWNYDSIANNEKHLYTEITVFVKDIIQEELTDMDVTVVHFDNKYLK